MPGDIIVAQVVPRHGAKSRRLLQASDGVVKDGGKTKPSKPPKDSRPNKDTPPPPNPPPPTPAPTPVPVSSPSPSPSSSVGAPAPTRAPTTTSPPNASPPSISTSPAPVSPNPPPAFTQVTHSSGGISLIAIIIIVVVAAVVLGAIAVLFACCRRRKGRNAARDGLPPGGKNESGMTGSQPHGPLTAAAATRTRSTDTLGGTSVGSSVEGGEEVPTRGSQFGGRRKTGGGALAAFGAGFGGGMGHLGGGGGAVFTPSEIDKATNYFSDDNFLGKGGFGKVYRGVTSGGQEIAVKVLVDSGDGEREFMREAQIISQVHHRNLVTLYGCCVLEGTRMLILEYVPGGTLMDNLERNMDWGSRVQVILGVAKGLAYLHHDCHPRIFHRDIKSENILIDDQKVAKVADFGLAKLAFGTNTHTTTRVMGSPGYVAPEYAASGQISSKSDVFSFGVVVLEAVSGQKPNDRRQPMGQQTLYKRARLLLEMGRMEELIDRRLEGCYKEASMRRMMETASYCIREAEHLRPTMAEVVQMLQGHESDALRRLRETEPGSSGRESAGSVGVFGGEVTSSELLSQPWLATSGYGGLKSVPPHRGWLQTVSSTVSERTQTRESTSASPNPTLDFANHPSSISELPYSEIDPKTSAYPSQPDFRSPSGLVSQQFEGYKSDSGLTLGNGSGRSSGPVLGEIKEGSAVPPPESADFSTSTPSQKSSGEGASFGTNQERLPPSERIVFTSEFSLPKNTERLSSGR